MKDQKRMLPLHAASLRCLALALMLLDHMWITVIPGNNWMTFLGRLAFPIFAFQTAEGYFHTANLKKYMLRLLVFGLISEIPFNLMVSSFWIYPFHQNVMFTLLIGLAALDAVVRAKAEQTPKRWVFSGLLLLGYCLLAQMLCLDYGGYGVMMVLLFGLTRNVRHSRLWQAAGMILVNVVLMEGMTIPVFGVELPVQSFAVLALGLIWLYNGHKGTNSKFFQYGSYAFYPLHMVVLYGIRYFS